MILADNLAAVTLHQWLNVAIAALGAFVAFGAANRMSRETECTIIFAFATVGAGFTAWAACTVFPQVYPWEHAFDTLLLGGMVALLIGTRRRTIWLRPEWMPKLSLGVSAATWFAFFVSV